MAAKKAAAASGAVRKQLPPPAKKAVATKKSPAKKASRTTAQKVKKSAVQKTGAAKSPGGRTKAKSPAAKKKAGARVKMQCREETSAKEREELPTFKYHPNVLKATGGTGVMVANDVKTKCYSCLTVPDYIYTGPLYHAGDHDPALCAPCIANGSAADKFKCVFSGQQLLGKCSADAKKELFERTPGFPFFNEGERPVHCQEPCALISLAPKSEIKEVHSTAAYALAVRGPELTDSVCQLVAMTKKKGGWGNVKELFPGETSDSSAMLADCAPNGDISLVAYACVRCQARRYTFDMS